MSDLSQHFRRLADRFRNAEADNNDDGNRYCARLMAQAGRLLKQAAEAGKIKLWGGKWPDHRSPTEEPRWAQIWAGYCSVKSQQPDSLIPPSVGAQTQTEHQTTNGGRIIAGKSNPEDWKQRAADYADVCDVLADMLDTADDEQGDGEPADLQTRALQLLLQNPSLTNKQIADQLGCNPKSLSKSRCPRLYAAREANKASRNLPRGSKAEDGDLEAWE